MNDCLREGAGRHFDPVLVEAYFAIQDEFRGIAEQYADHAIQP